MKMKMKKFMDKLYKNAILASHKIKNGLNVAKEQDISLRKAYKLLNKNIKEQAIIDYSLNKLDERKETPWEQIQRGLVEQTKLYETGEQSADEVRKMLSDDFFHKLCETYLAEAIDPKNLGESENQLKDVFGGLNTENNLLNYGGPRSLSRLNEVAGINVLSSLASFGLQSKGSFFSQDPSGKEKYLKKDIDIGRRNSFGDIGYSVLGSLSGSKGERDHVSLCKNRYKDSE